MRLGVVILASFLAWQCAAAQEPQPAPQQPSTTSKRDTFMRMPVFGDLVRDQKAIATGPRHLRLQDSVWAAPLVGVTAGLIITDAQFSRHLNSSTSRIDNSNKLANYGVAGMAAMSGSYIALFGNADFAGTVFGASMSLQNTRTFQQGVSTGGQEAVSFIDRKQPALGLSDHLMNSDSSTSGSDNLMTA